MRSATKAVLVLVALSGASGLAQAQINKAPPGFTAPTAPTGTNNEQIATTRFVKNAITAAPIDAAHITGVLPIAHGGTACSVASGTCLDNITGFAATGIMARTGAGAYAFRTITGTANEIGVVNGDGIAGNPTLSLPAALTFTGKTVTGGTFVSGAFNGTLGATTPAALSATTGTFSSIVHLPNNVPLQARNAANSLDVNVIYLDPSDVFQLGGGDNVRIASPEASSSNSTGALRVAGGIYVGAQSYFVGPLGLGIATPTMIAAGSGLAAGITAGAGTIFVTPYVDSNLTTSSFVVQTVDQAAASTNGGTGYEYAVIGGMKTTHDDGSLAPNKVAVAGMTQISGATSGNGWGGYFLVSLDSGSRAGSFAVGVEIDSINSTTTDRNYSNLGTPSYGLQITGTSNKTNTAALLLSGAPGVPQWYAGIVFNNSRSATQDYGIDLAFDGNNTFGVTALRLPNNQTISWKKAGGTTFNALYLDAADVFQVGAGLPIEIAGTISSSGTAGVTCGAGITAATFRSVNGIVTHC